MKSPKALFILQMCQSFRVQRKSNLTHFLKGRRTPRCLCTLANDLSKYAYWKKRYSPSRSDEKFDWFLESHKIYPHIEFHIEEISKLKNQSNLRYAELGCGISELSLVTFRESKTALQMILSDFVMEALQYQATVFEKVEPRNMLTSSHLICGDILNLPLKNESLSIVVDKGTMDSLLKDRCEGQGKAKVMFSEVLRVLESGGRYIQVTDEDPDSRLLLLEGFLDEAGKDSNSNSLSEHLPGPSVSSFPSHKNNEQCSCTSTSQKLYSTPDMDSKHFNITWSFKVIFDDSSDKEYFIYWCDKR